ncbi:hypothetical protein QMK19_03765 [Streptomyces sp. H10-C2]|uniref:hypothetical protein n=1 Tax=unclassified Streptomyces TaxID=2593676 RepID=UPI0024BB24B0|nr:MULTISPECIES: hypothetical protein [unclassified Streptomyces]MDJ0345235.1 hypothetical protein [Streptomyces sp. PH10-H1]MDJ0368819.1 hypothetical protein [Streptomyces sp. H10-C2]
MKRAVWIVSTAGLVALSYYLVAYRWDEVGGNIEAQVVIITPAFAVHHLLIRRRADRQHAQTVAAIGAADPSTKGAPG